MRGGVGLPGAFCGVALAGALSAVALSWPAEGAPSSQLQAWMTGDFVLDERRDVVERRLGQAVERVVDPMGPSVRAIARSQLSRIVHYCRGYQLALSDEEVRIRCDEEPLRQHRLQLPIADEADGVRVELTDDAVALTPLGDGRETVYRFDEQGRLEVQVRVTSEQLGRALDWSVRYRRTSPAAAPVSVAER